MDFDDFQLHISEWVLTKLSMKEIDVTEVEEAFYNSQGVYIEEKRKHHRTDPPTLWFISPTSDGRVLKICFIPRYELNLLILKTAFDAESWEIDEYENYL